MANRKITAKTSPEKLPDIVLTLDGESARILRSITGMIGGSGEGRQTIDALWNALGDANVSKDTSVSFSGSISGGLRHAE